MDHSEDLKELLSYIQKMKHSKNLYYKGNSEYWTMGALFVLNDMERCINFMLDKESK